MESSLIQISNKSKRHIIITIFFTISFNFLFFFYLDDKEPVEILVYILEYVDELLKNKDLTEDEARLLIG